MAISLSYDNLMDVAARAVGLDRAALQAGDETVIANVPNLAVEKVAMTRLWRHLVKQATLSCTAGVRHVLLPADFHSFSRDDALTYAQGASYGQLALRGQDALALWRCVAATGGPPHCAALGPGVDSLLGIAAAPAGSGSFSGTYRYRYLYFDASGEVSYSDVALASPAGKSYVSVSGWPTGSGGTVWLYRTSNGGATLQLLNSAIDAGTAAYQDSTADAGLGTGRYPADASYAAASFVGRQRLELFPTPDSGHVLRCTYRRSPRSMSAAGDTPDLPTILQLALLSAVRIVAREQFEQDVADGLEARFNMQVGQAADALLQQAPFNGRSLSNHVRAGLSRLPVGRNVNLAADWGT